MNTWCWKHSNYPYCSIPISVPLSCLVVKFVMWSLHYFSWVYWGDIGWQNHTGFKCTVQQNIVCTLHHAPIAPSKISFHSHLSPHCPLLLPPTFFHQALQAPSLLTAVKSILCICGSVSISFVKLFCSLDLEKAQVPISRGVDEKAVQHLHNGILVGHKNKETLPFATARYMILKPWTRSIVCP